MNTSLTQILIDDLVLAWWDGKLPCDSKGFRISLATIAAAAIADAQAGRSFKDYQLGQRNLPKRAPEEK
jgi:hypothetical protein